MIKHLLVARALTQAGITDAHPEWLKPVEITPSGNYTLSIRLGNQTPLAEIEKRSVQIAHALRAFDVEIRQLSPRRFELTVYKAKISSFPKYPVPDTCPLFPLPAKSVPLGIDANGYQVDLPLFDSAGGQVVLLAGNPGTGKSSTLSLAVYGLADTSAHIVWFDPKGAADAGRHRSRVEVVRDPIKAENTSAALQKLLDLCEERSKALGEQLSLEMLKPIVVIVDEWAALGLTGDKKVRDEVPKQLRTLTALARASRVSVILSTQRPTTENIDVTTRSLASTRICFAVGDKFGSIAALGSQGAELLNSRKDRGVALVEMGNGPKEVKIFEIPSDLLEKMEQTRGYSATIDDIAAWDQISFTEQRSQL